MKVFEQFIRYLCIAGVFFAVLYAVFPEPIEKVLSSFGMIFGPILVVVLLVLSVKKKPKNM